MKKFLAVLLVGIIVVSVSLAYTNSNKEEKTTTSNVATTKEIPTDTAVLKESEALSLFQSGIYSEKELGLDKIERSYTFMIAGNGFEYDGGKYVRVVANCPSKTGETTPNGDEKYTLTTVGEYLISFDGKTILMKNFETGEYKELENRYSDYSSKGDNTTKAE